MRDSGKSYSGLHKKNKFTVLISVSQKLNEPQQFFAGIVIKPLDIVHHIMQGGIF